MDNILRQKRKQLGLTQEQAAKACGVSRRTYQTYEETNTVNTTLSKLLEQIEELYNPENIIYNVKTIKNICRSIFEQYPKVECAYLYGSYARGEATGKSDIDILVVCPPMGMRFYKMAVDLEKALNKEVDLQTHRQLAGSEDFVATILKEGIKIYG